MKKTLYTTFMSLSALLLIACGGGSSGSNANDSYDSKGSSNSNDSYNSNEGRAFYVDSAVEGVSVTCGTKVSLTDKSGAFTYVKGEICSFAIANIILREEGGITEGKSIFENNVTVAQFLQSLDIDNNPSNGISISAEVIKMLENNEIKALPSSNIELQSIVSTLQDEGTSFFGDFVTKAEAEVHLNETENTLNNYDNENNDDNNGNNYDNGNFVNENENDDNNNPNEDTASGAS
jgi:hypothetical protein